MAQCKVTDFYAVQKKSSDVQPSKRRKVVRMNEPAILTNKKTRGKVQPAEDSVETPILVVTSGPLDDAAVGVTTPTSQPPNVSFQPSKELDLNFNRRQKKRDNKDKSDKSDKTPPEEKAADEVHVFSANQPPPLSTASSSKLSKTAKSISKSESTDDKPASTSTTRGRPKRGAAAAAKKKKTKKKDDNKEEKSTNGGKDASTPITSTTTEVVGEEATAHENDHELVVTPPSSPSKLKEIQQGRKRPKKVSVIVRVNEGDGGEAAAGGGEEEEEEGRGGGGEDEGGATPRKLKKVEDDGQMTPKRTPQQLLTPSQMLTPSPRTVGCLPGSIKKLTLSSARKKLNLGGDEPPLNGSLQSLKQRQSGDAPTAAKGSPILDKARNLIKRLSESVSPSTSPTSAPSQCRGGDDATSTTKIDGGEGKESSSITSTPVKGKGKGKNSSSSGSNRVEELKRKIKEAKEKQRESTSTIDDGAASSSSSKQGLDSLISRLGKNNNNQKSQKPSVVVEHGAATQAKSNKLLELQAKLKAIDNEKKALKKDVVVEKKTSEKVAETTTTTKTTTEKGNGEKQRQQQPAYQKYAHLAEKVEAPNGELPLPFKYKIILEFFRNMDQAVSLYYNRKEMITFCKLKGAVQELTRRSFDEKHLAQIMTVYPDSYELRREKSKVVYGIKNPNNYNLTVEPRLSDAGATNCDVRSPMSAAQLLNRRHRFHHSLINLIRKHHTKFLESLTPPVRVDEAKVQRWHPNFRLEEIPEVPHAALPAAPEVEKFSTAKEVLDKAKGSMNQRIEAALKQMAESKKKEAANAIVGKEPAKTGKTSDSAAPSSSTTATTTAAAEATKKTATTTKGIPPALLAKIREKEAKKAVENLVMSGESSERVNMLGRLPNFVKILRTFFLTEKKPALLIEEVVKKVSDSHRSALAGNGVEAHVKLIAEVAPEWLTITKLSSGTYVKINKTMDINKILQNVEKEKRRTNS